MTSVGGGAGAAGFCTGVEGLEGSAVGVFIDCALRGDPRAGVAGAALALGAAREGDWPPCLLDLRPLRPRAL